ncbi:MAG TPA: AMP-binding protein [Candidatus Binatus sp.]|nr:AMP-binding protein [Candidatus Binatus sp.]
METLGDLVRSRARDRRPVLIDDPTGAVVAGTELAARVEARARALADAGVRPGDRVALLLPNSLACAESLLAVAGTGAAAVPINLRWTAAEVDRLLADAEPRVLVAAEGRVAALGRLEHCPPLLSPDAMRAAGSAPAAPGPDDPALILYTSGTTGRAKGAMLTHRNLVSNARVIAAWLRLGPTDRFLMVMPLFHANAIMLGLLTPLLAGAGTVIAERFRAPAFWASVDRYRPTTAGTVPTMLAMLLALPEPSVPFARSSLRFLLTGSAPVPADLLRAFEARFGVPVIEGYGLTECTCRATFNPIDGRRRPGSCGLPLEPLRIVDAEDRDVAPGEIGEIVLRGPHVMRGYFRDPTATAAALRGGWLHSGDLGRIDPDGFVHVVGRASEMIIRGGENVYPREIEETLLAHPDVAEAAVVGAPDALYGEVVWAFLVSRADGTLDEGSVARWCSERLADFKRPARITIVPELPKGPTGKILKAPLRTLAATQP